MRNLQFSIMLTLPSRLCTYILFFQHELLHFIDNDILYVQNQRILEK